jgi:hypothetical protein
MNEDKWIKCTKCGVPIPPEFEPEFTRRLGDEKQFEQIKDGVKLIFCTGYGMFTDIYPDSDQTTFLCHDCVVELLEFFPESFRQQFEGGHSFDHTRCCRYGWTSNEFVGKGEENE